jgi:hypothetical protein
MRKKPSNPVHFAQRSHVIRACGQGALTARDPLLASGPRRLPASLNEGARLAMVFIRRMLLIVLLLVVPVVLTAAIYALSIFVLQMTNRTIEPRVLHYSAVVEYAAFLFLAFLEVKNRW